MFKKIKPFLKNNGIKLILLFLCLDVLMIAIHLSPLSNYGFFHIDYSRNFPTMYQAFKVMFFGYHILFFFNTLQKEYFTEWWQKAGFAAASFTFIYIGIDELTDFHNLVPVYVEHTIPEFAYWFEETLRAIGYNSVLWVIYYIPVVIFFFIPGLLLYLWTIRKNKVSVILAATAFFLFFMVFVVEVWNTTGELSPRIHNYSLALEEFMEKLGMTLFGYTSYNYISQKLKIVKSDTKQELIK